MKTTIEKYYRVANLYTLISIPLFLYAGYMTQHKHNRVTVVQSFNNFPSSEVNSIYKKLKVINPNTILSPPIKLPSAAY